VISACSLLSFATVVSTPMAPLVASRASDGRDLPPASRTVERMPITRATVRYWREHREQMFRLRVQYNRSMLQ
jgi:hypothetical protein